MRYNDSQHRDRSADGGYRPFELNTVFQSLLVSAVTGSMLVGLVPAAAAPVDQAIVTRASGVPDQSVTAARACRLYIDGTSYPIRDRARVSCRTAKRVARRDMRGIKVKWFADVQCGGTTYLRGAPYTSGPRRTFTVMGLPLPHGCPPPSPRIRQGRTYAFARYRSSYWGYRFVRRGSRVRFAYLPSAGPYGCFVGRKDGTRLTGRFASFSVSGPSRWTGSVRIKTKPGALKLTGLGSASDSWYRTDRRPARTVAAVDHVAQLCAARM